MLNLDSVMLFNVFDVNEFLSVLQREFQTAWGWAETKYDEAPALAFGVMAALAVPVIAMGGVLMRQFSTARGLRHRSDSTATALAEKVPRTQPASAWRQRAWLEFAQTDLRPFPVRPGLNRIGREADNDLCLADPAVHRYHAVLEQTPDAEFYVAYTGDPDHDGLLVDGLPVDRIRLRGGEVLQLGAIKLRFMLSAA